MRKKISLILLVFVLAASLFGCGNNEEATDYNIETLEGYSDMIVQSFQLMTDEDFEAFKESSDFQLDYTLMSAGLPVDGDDFLVMIDSWQNAVKEYGALIDYDEYTVEESEDGVVLTAPAQFEEKEADIVFNFDKNEKMTSMTVDVHYTWGQILEKAGLNTLLGMGTVFVVLILIAFIISLFRFIPAIEAKFRKTPEQPTEKIAVPTPAAPAAAEDVTDDSELIAVIAAAIAAAEGTTTDGFIVRSIKRRKTNNWK